MEDHRDIQLMRAIREIECASHYFPRLPGDAGCATVLSHIHRLAVNLQPQKIPKARPLA